MIFARYRSRLFAVVVVSAIVILFTQCTPSTDLASAGDLVLFPRPGDFDGPIDIRITSDLNNARIVYTTDGNPPNADSQPYTGSFTISRSSVIQASAFDSEGRRISSIGGVFLITPGNGAPAVTILTQSLDNGFSRFEAQACDPEDDLLSYRWYIDGRIVAGETDAIFQHDLRTDYNRIVTVSVTVSDGDNRVSADTETAVAALPVQIDLSAVPELVAFQAPQEIRNRAPSVVLRAPFGVIEYDESMRVEAGATDPEGDSLEYVWIVDGEIVQRGAEPFLDFSRKPEKGNRFTIQVAVSDGHNLQAASIPVYVNEAQPSARLTSVSGDVQIQRFSGEWVEGRRGMALDLSDTVATGFGSSAVIEAGDSEVRISAMTRMTLDALGSSEGVQETSLFLRVGSVYAEVDASEGAHDFKVMGPHATASVRGTQFSFDGLNLRVVSGAVAMKVGPPERNIQRARPQNRAPVEATVEGDPETGGAAAEDVAADEAASEEETGEEIAEEAAEETAVEETAPADDTSDEVLVAAGETAELDIEAGGSVSVTASADEDLVFDFSSDTQEVSIPERARLQVNLQFQDADASSTISDGTNVLIPSR